MFLVGLTDKQKMAYLELSYSLIAADGLLSNDEVLMMEQYKQEMSLTVQLSELSHNPDHAIAEFQNASDVVKKQVLFELTGLAYADNEYVEAEQEFLEKICEAWSLESSILEFCKTYMAELMSLYDRIGHFITG